MAKIVSDSLIVSKTGAPLGTNDSVATLADIEKIQNPSNSLIFFVEETGLHYKPTSFKEVQIAGTSLTKKVIDKYEPISDDKLDYEELGEVDMDDLFDQQGMNTIDVADVPDVDFDKLT